jgi:predicted secreted acid phosphatase
MMLMFASTGVSDKAGTHRKFQKLVNARQCPRMAIAQQTFAGAIEKLAFALRDHNWTASTEQFATGDYQHLPPAVIVNLDETVWSNSLYQARIILQYGQHDINHFITWCNEAKCVAIPGAKEFLDHAKRQDVSIVYITPRGPGRARAFVPASGRRDKSLERTDSHGARLSRRRISHPTALRGDVLS